MSDKTEEPTPRRLRKAREEGDSGASTYASQAAGFVVAVALVPAAIGALASREAGALRAAIVASAGVGSSGLAVDPWVPATAVIALTAPVLLAVGAAAAIVQLAQTGGTIASARLTPKLERLNPAAGLAALFSGSRLFAVVRAIVAGAAVGWLGYRAIVDHVVDFARVAGRPEWLSVVLPQVAGGLARSAAWIGLALGVIDLVVTRRAWLRKLRMSKDEIKREHKDAEGDPQAKQARERAYHELLAQATLARVRDANVVITNPTHLACALRYDGQPGGDAAPVVVASGAGELAARIIEAAHQANVPVVRDVPLARAIRELAVDDAIPEALYEAVAQILRDIAPAPAS